VPDDERPVTIHDVAKRAGVAVSSVSRVLSKHPDVSEKMRVKVEAAARELGYTPDPVARSLRSGSSRLIGYVVRDFQTPFFSDVIEGLEAVLTAEGYTLLVLNGGGQPAKELERISVLKQRRVDGLFLSTLVDSTLRLKSAVSSFDRPVVLIDRDIPGSDVGRALFDHASGVSEATAHLVSLGHTRIALITGAPDVRPTRERLAGFRLGLGGSTKAQSQAIEVTGAFSVAFARERTAELLALPVRRRPTALMAGGVQATIGVLEALSEAGLRPGEDISLVVVDDQPWLRILRPSISAVSRDPAMIGRVAAGLMIAQLAGEKPSTVTLPTRFESRESTLKVGSR
jgi:LacI family transcriptional regulator